MRIGLDTGFFFLLLQDHSRVSGTWDQIASGEMEGVLSCLSLFELARIGLRGALPEPAVDQLLEEIPHVCQVVWIRAGPLLDRAARIAHGNGLAMADAIILSSMLEAEVEEIHTTDRDLGAYAGGPPIVLLRRNRR